ncbi:MAG: hypothetical protein JNM07_02785 [Phycisphaerae bacterium]|nr:hypothetical protein [Phycisphaerae bacterium]
MATVQSVNASARSPVSAPPASKGVDALGSQDFLKLIFTELGKQDPLKPNDTNTLLQQLSTIRSIQSDVDLSDRLARLVGQNELASAGGLIGRRVAGLDPDAERIEGQVISVTKTKEGAVLTLDGGRKLPYSGLESILEAAVRGDAPENGAES